MVKLSPGVRVNFGVAQQYFSTLAEESAIKQVNYGTF